MKISRNYSQAIIITLAAVVLVGSGLYYASNSRLSKSATAPVPTGSPSPTPTAAAKPGIAGNPGDSSKSNIQDKAGETPTPVPAASSLSIFLIRAGQSGKGLPIEIRAQLSGASSGTCTASFTSQSAVFSRTSAATFDGRTTTCGVFDIPASDFPYDSTWALSLKATSGNQTSNTTTQNITVSK